MGRKLKKLIPKEIRPAVPALAAVFGPAALFGTGGIFAGTALASAPIGIQAAIINAATQAATTGKVDAKQAALSGITSQLGSSLSKYGSTQAVPSNQLTSTALSSPEAMKAALAQTSGASGTQIAGQSFLKGAAETAGSFLNPQYASTGDAFKDAASYAYAGTKAALPTASYAYGKEIAELNEKALRDYEAQLREQGIMDSADRRNKIFGYFTNAGYSADETNAFLDKYGYAYGGPVQSKPSEYTQVAGNDRYIQLLEQFMYEGYDYDTASEMAFEALKSGSYLDEDYDRDGKATGGRVGFKKGGGIQALIDYLKEKEDEDEEFNLSKFSSGLEGIKSGYEIATGQPLIGMKPQPTRFGLADGGIMNLGGREMDMRGGGFIPIGAKEKADDVPARLSKNEFVMTADAVRAAGGGSVNKGAKRMYDLMNRLEAKV